MINFLKCMGWVNWLVVSVVFQFDSSQTWSMFGVFFTLVTSFLIIMSVIMASKKSDGLVFDNKPSSITSLIWGNVIDVLFFSGVAYIIQNDMPFNIIILGVLVRSILFGIHINGRFVKG